MPFISAGGRVASQPGRRAGRRAGALLAAVTVAAGAAGPAAPAVAAQASAAGTPYAYVVNYGSNTVSAYDAVTGTAATIPVGTHPRDVGGRPGGRTAHVTNREDSDVSVIDTATNTVTATIPVGAGPWGVAVSRDGTTVYVADAGSG